MIRRGRLGLMAVAMAWGCAATGARASDLHASAQVTPPLAHVGQPVRYTGMVIVPVGRASRVRWLPPEPSAALSWGRLHASMHRAGSAAGADTIMVEATLQAFRVGIVTVPGIAFRDDAGAPGVVRRLPVMRLDVMSVIPASDSSAELRPVRGLAAPWWEVVPWGWVAAIALGLAALVWLVRALRRRGRRAAPAPAVATQPAELALERLAALRARRLPEVGRFDEHALELTAILRRLLEATTEGLRPGFTTSELARRLTDEAMPPEQSRVLVNLMRVWDRVKFARAASTLEEARHAEAAVERYILGQRSTPRERAA